MTKFFGGLVLLAGVLGGAVWTNNTYKVTERIDETARSWFGDYVDCPICKELVDLEAKKCPNCLEWISEENTKEQ